MGGDPRGGGSCGRHPVSASQADGDQRQERHVKIAGSTPLVILGVILVIVLVGAVLVVLSTVMLMSL
jgi:hypothetical protein